MTTRRVVLLHCRGALAGVSQILGCEDQLPKFLEGVPNFVDNVHFGDHDGTASLIRITPRLILYRENDVHPSPV